MPGGNREERRPFICWFLGRQIGQTLASALQQSDMSGMQNVIAAIGKYDFLAFQSPARPPRNQKGNRGTFQSEGNRPRPINDFMPTVEIDRTYPTLSILKNCLGRKIFRNLQLRRWRDVCHYVQAI